MAIKRFHPQYCRPELSFGFVKKYQTALQSVCDRIQKADPDFVLALTRTGPRLLELMECAGFDFGNVPVITEKSLDFVPKWELRNQKVVVFDDLVISGTTIRDMRSKLSMQYEVDVEVVTLAIDDERISIPRDTVSYPLEMSMDKRFQFSKELVQAFYHLNKPYDVDHAIFYSEMDDLAMTDVAQLPDSYDLTTAYQDNHGFSRYSVVPGGTDRKYISNDILVDQFADVQIEKLRVYYDRQTGAFVYTPVSIFSMVKPDTEIRTLFSESFEVYNQLLSDAREYLFADNEQLALYRLIWYLVSYINGIAYHQAYFTEKDPAMLQSGPANLLHRPDLEYLFGPDFGSHVRNFLSSHSRETFDAIDQLDTPETASPDVNVPMLTKNDDVHFDETQQTIKDEIDEYVGQNLNRSTPYTDQLATIFQGFHMEIEEEAQKENRRNGPEAGNDRPERRAGFNYHQLKHILREKGVDFDTEESQIGLSLTFDFLIDMGVQIPVFYEHDREGDLVTLERAYRHGEGVLNQKRFEYLVNEVTNELFDRVNETGTGPITRIGFEKIGVLLCDKLHNYEYWDDVAEDVHEVLTEPITGKIDGYVNVDVSPALNRHGKVQIIEDIPERNQDRMFSEWSDKKGIARYVDGGMQQCNKWKARTKVTEELLDQSKIAKLSNLAFVLHHVLEEMGSDYLVALTTCRSERETMDAMQTELQLFFKHDGWAVHRPISGTESLVEQMSAFVGDQFVELDAATKDEMVEDLHIQRKELNTSYEAVSGVRHKHLLRESLDETLGDIDDHFEEVGYPMSNFYDANLKTYVDNLAEIQAENEQSNFLYDKTVLFGEFCEQFCELYRSLIEVSIAILEQRNVRASVHEFYEKVDEWNGTLDQSGYQDYSGKPLDDFPEFDLGETAVSAVANRQYEADALTDRTTAVQLLADFLPQLKRIYWDLSDAFEAGYKEDAWTERLENLLPDSEKAETITAEYTVWYDMKNSSGEDRATRLKNALNARFDRIMQARDDGVYLRNMDDEKYVFVGEDDSAVAYLNGLLEESDDVGIYQRTSLCSVPSGEIRLRPDHDEPESDEAHLLANRLGEHRKRNGCERDDCHTVTITADVLEELDESGLLDVFADNWTIVDRSDDQLELDGIGRPIDVTVFKLK